MNLQNKDKVTESLVTHLNAVLTYAAKQTCLHEETHRGGAIWEICDSCGKKWADDEGGKPEDANELPKVIQNAWDFLDSLPTPLRAQGITQSQNNHMTQDEETKAYQVRPVEPILAEAWDGRDIHQMTPKESRVAQRLVLGGYMRYNNGFLVSNHVPDESWPPEEDRSVLLDDSATRRKPKANAIVVHWSLVVSLFVGFVLANFSFQFAKETPNWLTAFERSYFQGMILVFLWLLCVVSKYTTRL